jgi:hypothetical protein
LQLVGLAQIAICSQKAIERRLNGLLSNLPPSLDDLVARKTGISTDRFNDITVTDVGV